MFTHRWFVSGITAIALHPLVSSKDAKISVCTSDVNGAKKYGFDYVEWAAADTAAMSDKEFRDGAEGDCAFSLCQSSRATVAARAERRRSLRRVFPCRKENRLPGWDLDRGDALVRNDGRASREFLRE